MGIIDKAIQQADNDAHGRGYTLLIREPNGEFTPVSVLERSKRLIRSDCNDPQRGTDVLFNEAQIVSVTIVWQ